MKEKWRERLCRWVAYRLPYRVVHHAHRRWMVAAQDAVHVKGEATPALMKVVKQVRDRFTAPG